MIHLRGSGQTAPRLYEALLGRARQISVRGVSGNIVQNKWHTVGSPDGSVPLARVGFDDDQSLLPLGERDALRMG